MQDCVDPTLGLDLFWERFSDKDSIGRRQLWMQQIWFKSAKIAKKCARDQKQPSSLTQLIQPTWSLQRWGLDLLGPLPPAQGNLRYVVVAVEYFSKWIKAKPLATITSATVQKFFWHNIVCRFGVPKAITVDNGTQFDAETFKDFYDQIGTKIHFASVRHPESNRLVERANGCGRTARIIPT
jgi:IS30 family transposase